MLSFKTKSLSIDVSLLPWWPSIKTVLDQNQRKDAFFRLILTFTPVISDLCTGQQMEVAVKTLDPHMT